MKQKIIKTYVQGDNAHYNGEITLKDYKQLIVKAEKICFKGKDVFAYSNGVCIKYEFNKRSV